MLNFLPPRILSALRPLDWKLLYEIRLRANNPLTICYDKRFRFLSAKGICRQTQALIPTQSEVEETLFQASGGSIYSVENQIKEGFLTAKSGERIGIAGSYVYENGRVLSVRDVTSLCIRIPHEIHGCANEIFEKIMQNGVTSVVICAPPALGKTTILRELSRLICEHYFLNVLVCDERGELSAGNLGKTADCMRFTDKLTAFTAGIRAMRPDVIVTDELLPTDYPAVQRAMISGIHVLASAHVIELEHAPKGFEYYVFLKGLGEVGEIICGSK